MMASSRLSQDCLISKKNKPLSRPPELGLLKHYLAEDRDIHRELGGNPLVINVEKTCGLEHTPLGLKGGEKEPQGKLKSFQGR